MVNLTKVYQLRALLIAALFCSGSTSALACMVCGASTEETRMAFVLTTGLLTAVPLALLAGIAYVIYRFVRREGDE